VHIVLTRTSYRLKIL